MSVLPRFRLVDGVLLLAVVAAAAGLRAGYLVLCCNNAQSPSPLMVQGDIPDDQRQLIKSLQETWWFGGTPPFAAAKEQSAHVAPGYPWLLSLVARLPVEFDSTVRWGQCGLGALTSGLYFLFARRAFRSTVVGVLAGLLTAAHPYWIINSAEINDGVLAGFLLAASLVLAAHVGQEGGIFWGLFLGLILAAACLVRPTWLPFGFAAVLWLLWRCRELSRGWFLALLVVLGFVNGLAPWAVRNYQVLNDVVPVVDTAYVELWMGNNPQSTGGTQDEATMLEALAKQRGQDVAVVKEELAAMNAKQRSAALANAVLAEVQRDPTGAVQNRLEAGLAFFVSERWLRDRQLAQDRSPPAEGLPEWLSYTPLVLTATLLGMLLLGVLGWRWSYGWRAEAMPMALAVLFIPLPYILSHADALHGPRLPLDGVLLTMAAFALCCLVPGYGLNYLAGSEILPQIKDKDRR